MGPPSLDVGAFEGRALCPGLITPQGKQTVVWLRLDCARPRTRTDLVWLDVVDENGVALFGMELSASEAYNKSKELGMSRRHGRVLFGSCAVCCALSTHPPY